MTSPKSTAALWTVRVRAQWSLALPYRRRNWVGALSRHLLTDVGLASAGEDRSFTSSTGVPAPRGWPCRCQ